jgi:hypothetical protein
MLHVLLESGRFLEEYKKIQRLNSRLFTSAVGVLEASFWLIGGNRFAQALVMLDNAIELILKGELERIHRILIADTKNLGDFQTLKSLLKEAFRQHPNGNNINIPDFDIERTIYFEPAFDRVAELYPGLRDRWRKQLLPTKGGGGDSLHGLRNDIVHYGGDRALDGRYVAAIVEIALPFLEEMLRLVTGHEPSPINLRNLLMEWVYQYVEVARSVLKDLREHGQEPKAYAIAPLAHQIVWTHTQWPSPQDGQDTIRVGDEWYEFANRQKSPSGWQTDFMLDINCPICGSTSRDQAHIPAKVLIDEESLLELKTIVPTGFMCYLCGFSVDPTTQPYLAKHFVPPFPEEQGPTLAAEFGIR